MTHPESSNLRLLTLKHDESHYSMQNLKMASGRLMDLQ